MNSAKKGTRNEKKCEDALKESGYITWRTTRTMYQKLDIFGLFDVVGLSPSRDFFKFMQVKSNRCDKKTRDAIREFKMPGNCEKWVWIWVDRKGWKKEQL